MVPMSSAIAAFAVFIVLDIHLTDAVSIAQEQSERANGELRHYCMTEDAFASVFQDKCSHRNRRRRRLDVSNSEQTSSCHGSTFLVSRQTIADFDPHSPRKVRRLTEFHMIRIKSLAFSTLAVGLLFTSDGQSDDAP